MIESDKRDSLFLIGHQQLETHQFRIIQHPAVETNPSLLMPAGEDPRILIRVKEGTTEKDISEIREGIHQIPVEFVVYNASESSE